MNSKNAITVTSFAFSSGASIPPKYTCEGDNVNPDLHLEGLPADTVSLALIMEDPDAPSGTWVHWVEWNILPQAILKENTAHGIQGVNDFLYHNYSGPCPPSGIHRYYFRVFALTQMLALENNSVKADLLRVITPYILAYGELMGTYQRTG